jgi:site-specific recombinase
MNVETAAASIREQVVSFLDRGLGSDHDAYELASCFEAIAHADSLTHRLDSLIALMDWTREGPVDADGRVDRSRLIKAIEVLEALPDVRRGLQDTFADILSETEGVNLFGETGIPGDRGFIAELTDRVMGRVLPEPSDDHDLARLVSRLYASRAKAESFQMLAPELFHRIVGVIAPADRPERWAPLKTAFADGFRLLAIRVQAQGLSSKLRARSHPASVAQSPFHLLAQTSGDLMDAWRAGGEVSALASEWRELCIACRAETAEVTRRLESEGVSVDIVYGLEVLERCLSRKEAMLDIVESPPRSAANEAVHHLLTELIVAAHDDRSIRHLIRGNMQMLQRRIVDRSGKTGEHYVAHSRREYRFIWLAAAGGGLLTVLTAAIKLKVTHTGLPLFVEGLLAGLNYAVSFMLLHHFHLILATKQPAMTAATLATLLRSRDRTARMDSMVEFTVRICSSQFAAAAANVSVVFIGAFLFNFLWRLALGHNYLGEKEAQYLFETLSPVNSGTVFYAALTGVILWMAAMIGGWMDNWAVYHRLPQAIADHRLGERFGRKRMVRAAGVLSRNMSGWATNISLGFLLGLAPVVGQFLGLPIDVRHVTLSSGMLAFAGAGLRGWFTTGWFFWALAGVATMFVLNLGVSFSLSLYTASRAYSLARRELAVLGARLLRRFVRHPLDFVLPRKFEEKERGERKDKGTLEAQQER